MNLKITLFISLNVLSAVKTLPVPVPFKGFKYPGITSTFSTFFVNNNNNFFDNFFTSGGWGDKSEDAAISNAVPNEWNDNKEASPDNNQSESSNVWDWGNDIWGLGDNKDRSNKKGSGTVVGNSSSTIEFDTSNIVLEFYDEDADVPVIN